MPTLTFNTQVNVGSTGYPTKAVAVAAGSGLEFGEDIPAASTNLAVAAVFAVAKVRAYYLVADVDMTLETNDGATPIQTFALKAGVPFQWQGADDPGGNSFTTNVTAFYLTSVLAGTFTGYILIDPT